METFDSINFYLELTSGIWTDISQDVSLVDIPRHKHGFNDLDINSRAADTGILTFQLNNSQSNSAQLIGYYSPGHTNCRVGFEEGIRVKIEYTYASEVFDGWIGRIDSIDPSPFEVGTRQTKVIAVDWMNQATNHELDIEPAINKDFCELVALIIANMTIQPTETTYNTCESTFSYVLDGQSDTTAMTEFSYGARSEFGLIYLRRGENLVVEGRNTRSNRTYNSEVPVPEATAGYLQMHDGSYLLQADGYKFIISDGYEVDLTTSAMDVKIGNTGKATVVTATGYPRKVDAAANVTLFDLPSPIEMGTTPLNDYVARYKDATGAYRIVNGIDMVTPVANTHYKMYANKDGTGTDLTANLTVTATYYGDKVSYDFVNSGAAGYITMLKAVGRGIYFDNPFSYRIFNTAARALFGSIKKTLDMRYQDDPTTVQDVAQFIASRLSEPRRFIQSVKFNANRSQDTMLAFLYLDIGDRIRMSESVNAIDENSYIQAIEVEILPNKIVNYTYSLRPSYLDAYQYCTWDTIGSWDDSKYSWAP